MENFCVNCRHFKENYNHSDDELTRVAYCTSEHLIDLVYGEVKYQLCRIERSKDGLCNLDGRFYDENRF